MSNLVPYAGAPPRHRARKPEPTIPPAEAGKRHQVVDAFLRFWGRDLPPRIAQIIRECAAKHGTFPWLITGATRERVPTLARREAAYRLRQETRYSLPQIGRVLNRDHTTVLHAIRRYEEASAPRSLGRGEEPGSTGREARLSA